MINLLHIDMTDDVAYYLKKTDDQRTYRINKLCDIDQKKKQQKTFYEQLRQHTEKAQKEQCKRDGTVYEPRIGMALLADNVTKTVW